MPTTTTHARFHRKRAPTAALATRSPMSTKPPMAVRIPSVRARTFFTTPRSRVLLEERLESVDVVVERRGDRVELGELPAASGDANVGDVVLGVGQDRAEVVAQVVGALVRRLDRAERRLQAAEALLGDTQDEPRVGPDRVAARGRVGGEAR